MDELILELKNEIIKSLNLDINPDDIDTDAPLFGDGLGLDSIDKFELIIILESYGIVLTDEKAAKKIFLSVRTFAEFISANRK